MKQKIVMKVQMSCEKCRKEAMKIAATANGVMSVAIQGKDKDEIMVVGNEVDSAGLCTALRKKVGYAILLSIEEVKDNPIPEEKKKKGEKSEKKKGENSGKNKCEENEGEKEENKEEDNEEDNKEDDNEENNNKKKKKKKNKKKKEEEEKKPEEKPEIRPSCPPVYNPYPPPPNYCCPNPQFYMYTLPPDDNPGCVIM